MYMSWAVVLFGAVMTAAFPEWRAQKAFSGADCTALIEVTLSLDILSELRRGQSAGKAIQHKYLLSSVTAPEVLIETTLKKLRASGFAEPTEQGEWLLLRDLSETPMSVLLDGLGHGWTCNATTKLPHEWRDALSQGIEKCLEAEQKAWQMPVREIIDQAPKA